MLDDLKNFKIDNADAQKQMEDMLGAGWQDSRPASRACRARARPRHQEPRTTRPHSRRRRGCPRTAKPTTTPTDAERQPSRETRRRRAISPSPDSESQGKSAAAEAVKAAGQAGRRPTANGKGKTEHGKHRRADTRGRSGAEETRPSPLARVGPPKPGRTRDRTALAEAKTTRRRSPTNCRRCSMA